jgi:hypothetical protein
VGIFTIPSFQAKPHGIPTASKSRKEAMQPQIWAPLGFFNGGSAQESDSWQATVVINHFYLVGGFNHHEKY